MEDNIRRVMDDAKISHDGRGGRDYQGQLDPNQVYSFNPAQSSQEPQAGDYRRRHEDWKLNPKTPMEVSHIALIRDVSEHTSKGLLAVNEAKKLEN